MSFRIGAIEYKKGKIEKGSGINRWNEREEKKHSYEKEDLSMKNSPVIAM